MASSKCSRVSCFVDINKLSAAALKAYCVQFGIDISWPKSVKVNAVCHCLGISTSGNSTVHDLTPRIDGVGSQQQEEFRSLTQAVLYCMDGWTSDLTKVPLLDDADVKRYLLQTNLIDASSTRTYKLTRPYQLRSFVHSLRYHSLESYTFFCAVRGLCNPSQSTNKDEVKMVMVILDKNTGQPYGGYCTCTVGYCQSCGHIGAVLFCLSDLVATGFTHVPSQLSCTEMLCKWTDPKAADAKPATLHSMAQQKSTKVTRFQQKDRKPAPLNPEDVLEFRSKLLNATVAEGSFVPAIHALGADRFFNTTLPSVPLSMPDYACDLDNAEIVYAYEVVVTDCPLPVAMLPHKLFDSISSPGYEEEKDRFVASVCYNDSERANISKFTLGQSENLQWFQQRMGSITSSHFRAASRSILCGTSVPKSLVLRIQNYQQRGNNSVPQTNVPSLKWGVMNESNGRTAYKSLMARKHRGFKVGLAGLIACRNEPFLRASPDGIVTCSCHAESWLLEIKCPWTIKHLDPKEAVDQGLLTYIQKVGDSYHLHSDHKAGYYEQVQGAMAIAVAQMCDFVVWTPNGTLVLHVPFDNDYWINYLKPKLVTFFTRYVVPEILTERLRRGLVLLDTSSTNLNGSSSLTDSGNMLLDELLRACIAPEVIETIPKVDQHLGNKTPVETEMNVEDFVWDDSEQFTSDIDLEFQSCTDYDFM